MFNPLLDLSGKTIEDLMELRRTLITKLQQSGIANSSAYNQINITLDTVDMAIQDRTAKDAIDKDKEDPDNLDELIST
jgi:hypothetical protein|tara:strand:+ start:519 stop:752 length:234 start_codon:yes stop_codon:yes gene_type:complete